MLLAAGLQCGPCHAARATAPQGGQLSAPLPRTLRGGVEPISRKGSCRAARRSRSATKPFFVTSASAVATAPWTKPEVLSCVHYDVGISVAVGRGNGSYKVVVRADHPRPGLVLHWAINDWELPPQALWPAGTTQAGAKSLETPFQGGQIVTLTFPETTAPSKMVFVLKEGDNWTNNKGEDFTAELKLATAAKAATFDAPAEPQVVSHTEYDAGVSVVVARGFGAYQVEVTAHQTRPDLVLHWGADNWEMPPKAVWPAGTVKAGDGALQTPFQDGNSVRLTFPESVCPSKLVFVLKEKNQWTNNHGGDFTAELRRADSQASYSAPPPPKPEVLSHAHYDAGVSVVVVKGNGFHQVVAVADQPRPDLVMHWAVNDWQLPSQSVWPPGSVQAGDGAVQTPFEAGKSVAITFPENICPSKMVFVLKEKDVWTKNNGADFTTEVKNARVQEPPRVAEPAPEPEMVSHTQYDAGISVVVGRVDEDYLVVVAADRARPNLVMHWAVNDWEPPAEAVWPANTVRTESGALQTPFRSGQFVSLKFPASICPSKLVFVLKEGDNWTKNGNGDFIAHLKHNHMAANGHASDYEVLSRTHYEAGILDNGRANGSRNGAHQRELALHH